MRVDVCWKYSTLKVFESFHSLSLSLSRHGSRARNTVPPLTFPFWYCACSDRGAYAKCLNDGLNGSCANHAFDFANSKPAINRFLQRSRSFFRNLLDDWQNIKDQNVEDSIWFDQEKISLHTAGSTENFLPQEVLICIVVDWKFFQYSNYKRRASAHLWLP